MSDMGIMVRERAQEVPLMEQKRDNYVCGELQPEPQLPSGWEKCLDLKSGLIYFRDWNSSTLTYRDPRQAVPPPVQRIGLLSISLLPDDITDAKLSSNAGEGFGKRFKGIAKTDLSGQPARLSWGLSTAQITSQGDSSDRETTSLSMDEVNDQSLELTLNLPGTTSRPTPSNQEDSVCTVEKVRSALERSQWLSAAQLPKKRPACSSGHKLSDTLSTALSLLSSQASTSRESNSFGPPYSTSSKSSSQSTSQCSSEGFTSPSAMSYQGDDEEVQQPRTCGDSNVTSQQASSRKHQVPENGEVMVTVGCKSCLMYVMLSKSHPSCPKCGNADVLLELPSIIYPSLPKKQRMTLDSPTWSWCTA